MNEADDVVHAAWGCPGREAAVEPWSHVPKSRPGRGADDWRGEIHDFEKWLSQTADDDVHDVELLSDIGKSTYSKMR